MGPPPQQIADAKDFSATADAVICSPPSPLAGFIFMCNGATKPECFRYRVLGLPRWRLDTVSRIKRGAGLFLYDFDARYLYGPYLADSDGGLALEPAAFQGRYPAQVKFTIHGDFMPIPENSVRSAIKENYSRGKFTPELTFAQVEKLTSLFRPVTLLPESAPGHYVDDRHPASSASYLPPLASHATQPAIDRHPAPSAAHLPPLASHPTQPAIDRHPPPSDAYLPSSASHPAQPAAYVHLPTAHVPPAAYSHLAPPTAQFNTHPCYVAPTGHLYQAGYEAYGPLPPTYQYLQDPPNHYFYTQAQHPMPEHAPAPVYSIDPYFTANRNDPYRYDAVKFNYQQSTSERTVYGAPHQVVPTNLQPVRHHGSTPSSEAAAPEAAATNLGLERSYGSIRSSATEGSTQPNA